MTNVERKRLILESEKHSISAAEIQRLKKEVAETSKQRQRWTKEKVKKLAQAFTSRTAFRLGIPAAYEAAKRLKCLDEACAHMPARARSHKSGQGGS